MEGRETLFFFDVPGTRRPCTSKHEKVPFFERERSVFVLLGSKKNACGHDVNLLPCPLLFFLRKDML